ncbi:hypothetical protein Rhal01_02388 [Rubritalea halochordaticola]|uniref:Uncharacterized protein n=1 Tax=Rubritalea halochordaticola TaxID=714537 RepID=A0ABP9V534_9BACT
MKKTHISVLALSVLSLSASGQVLSPTGSGSIVPSSKNTASGSNDTTITRTQQNSASPHGEELPLIDPTQKTVTFQGRTYSLMDNNLGGQFEAYLASTEFATQAAIEYRETIQQILEHLSPTNEEGQNLKAAYELLEKASDYPGDGNICESLGNSIYSALLTKQGIGSKKEAIERLNKERDRIIYNMGIMESKLEFQTPQPTGGKGGKNGKNGRQQNNSRVTSTEYLMMQKRLVEIEAIKKKYEGEGAISLTQSKIQYQAMMVQLFMQRRFEHVVISSRFYNLIFKDGDQKMRLKKGSDTEKFFSEGIGVNPTVSGLDAAANEAIRKTRTLIDAFRNNLAQDRLHAASERLVEAYAIGEFLPVVQTVPIDSKARIQQYVQDGNDLIEALSAKELARATELNESLKSQATDYNSSKANSYISAHKRGSDSYVRDAKFALLNKETDKFKVAMENAIKMWPGNPAIGDLNSALDKQIAGMTEDQDLAANAIKDFDNLLAAKSYRAMLEEPRKSTFVVVLGKMNDEARMKQLEEIGTSIEEIEKALETAKQLEAAGQPHAAWEAVYKAQVKYFDDPKIANTKARLAGEVATFTNALTRAKNLEEKNIAQTGSALSWYLEAKRIYPNSKFANEGIQRLLDLEFGEGAADVSKEATQDGAVNAEIVE